MKSSELLKLYEDQRRYPRIPISIPVRITYKRGQVIEARVHDISPDGIQFRVDEITAVKLIPESGYIEPASRPKISLSFSLCAIEKETQIQANAEICYALFLGDDTEDGNQDVAFGVEFKKLKGKSKKALLDFLFK